MVFVLVGSLPLVAVAVIAFGILVVFFLTLLQRKNLSFTFSLMDCLGAMASLLASGIGVRILCGRGEDVVLGLLTHYLWQAAFMMAGRSMLIMRASPALTHHDSAFLVFVAGILGFFASMLASVLFFWIHAFFWGHDWL